MGHSGREHEFVAFKLSVFGESNQTIILSVHHPIYPVYGYLIILFNC